MKKIVMIMMVLAILLGVLPLQAASAATTKYEFSVTNYTNRGIVIELTDTNQNDDGTYDTYDVFVQRFDDVTKEFPKSVYNYVYMVCDVTYTGELKLKNDVEWEILPCGVEPTKMRFNSHISDKLVVSMYGPLEMPDPEEEEFEVELGGNPIADILSGTYVMTYGIACSTVGVDPKTVFSEEVRVAKSGTTQIMIRGCEWYSHPARTYDKPVPVKFRIVNHASFPLILQIVGPQGALLDVNPGVNLYSLIYGTYKYGYFLDGAYRTGYMNVTKNGLGQLVLKPSYIFELPTTEGTEDSGG